MDLNPKISSAIGNKITIQPHYRILMHIRSGLFQILQSLHPFIGYFGAWPLTVYFTQLITMSIAKFPDQTAS